MIITKILIYWNESELGYLGLMDLMKSLPMHVEGLEAQQVCECLSVVRNWIVNWKFFNREESDDFFQLRIDFGIDFALKKKLLEHKMKLILFLGIFSQFHDLQ